MSGFAHNSGEVESVRSNIWLTSTSAAIGGASRIISGDKSEDESIFRSVKMIEILQILKTRSR